MSKWTDFVKAYATKNGLTYKNALSSAECKSEYAKANPKAEKVPKGKGIKDEKFPNGLIHIDFEAEPKSKGEGITMTVAELKSKRGRPKKYATPEEAKAAKTAASVASNKRQKAKSKEEGGMLPWKKSAKINPELTKEQKDWITEAKANVGRPFVMPSPPAEEKTIEIEKIKPIDFMEQSNTRKKTHGRKNAVSEKGSATGVSAKNLSHGVTGEGLVLTPQGDKIYPLTVGQVVKILNTRHP